MTIGFLDHVDAGELVGNTQTALQHLGAELKELWYQRYVEAHPLEFGLSKLDGPFDTGLGFRAEKDGARVTVEVEKDYLAYRQHEHPIFGHSNIGGSVRYALKPHIQV